MGAPSSLPLNPEAVRLATHRALAARERLLKDYRQWEAWRRQARDLKREAMAAWETNLERLSGAVRAWGGQVLVAPDAAQARAQILEVARRHGVRTVVKSKSMTTEEIGLNPALAAAGLTVTETDLGEFIVQLAGHPPAHITAPALHLNRLDIARLFARHLGYAQPAEPEALCGAARRHLAPRFEAVQLGITGVNFAVPDGTLVFLENEGNLRRTACSPAVHLAVMGLEKLIPRLADLAVFLRLLPASATGQRLTALVHMLKGLKEGPMGGQAFYLLLLDNGRRRLGRDPELREALFCLRCGACLNICPVFQVGGAHLYGRVYPGAIGILLAPYVPPWGDLPDLCTQCGACGDVCPAAIPLPDLILKVRRRSRRYRSLRRLASFLGEVARRPGLYRRAEQWVRRVPQTLLRHSVGEILGAPPASASFHALSGPGLPSPEGESRSAAVAATGFTLPPREREGGGTNTPESARDLPGGRFVEAGSDVVHLSGSAALAAFLASLAEGPIWLEHHPWLAPVVKALQDRGLQAQAAAGEWGPEADTVVSVGLGAVPETGSALLAPPPGPAAWLPFRACRQVVVVPADRAQLSLDEALDLTAHQPGPLLTWLTGPTRTADIEKILVLGAQGPGALHVVVYDPGT